MSACHAPPASGWRPPTRSRGTLEVTGATETPVTDPDEEAPHVHTFARPTH